MMRKKDLRKVNADSATGYFAERRHKPLVSRSDWWRGYATTPTRSCSHRYLITCNIAYETTEFTKVTVLCETHEHLFAEEVCAAVNQPRNKNSNDPCVLLFHPKWGDQFIHLSLSNASSFNSPPPSGGIFLYIQTKCSYSIKYRNNTLPQAFKV